MTSNVRVTARDRKGRRLALPALRATYDMATAALPQRPALPLEIALPVAGGAENGAEAVAQLAVRRGSTAFAALLKGLLEISRRHRDVDFEVEMTGGDEGESARLVRIRRGAFEGEAPKLASLVERLTVTRTGHTGDSPEAAPHPGAERIGHLEDLREILDRGVFALTHAGSIYVPDGPETARRITPPGRFTATAWDRTGTALAVLGRADGADTSLWLSVRGSGLRAVQSLGTADPTGAAFSPDGASLAVTLAGGRLAVLPADGASAALIQVARAGRVLEPAWSPDGQSIACLVEESSRARTLMLVSLAEGGIGARLFAVDPPADDELAIAAPTFSPDGLWIFVRALWGAKGDPRRARLLRVPVVKGSAEALPLHLTRVKPAGAPASLRDGALFLGGIGESDEAPVSAAWIDPAALYPDAAPPALVAAPTGARLSFPGPRRSIVFLRRSVKATRIYRLDPDGTVRKARLPFSAWLTLP